MVCVYGRMPDLTNQGEPRAAAAHWFLFALQAACEHACGAFKALVQRSAPVTRQPGNHYRTCGLGAQFNLASLVNAASGAVHVRELHFGAGNQCFKAAQRKANTLQRRLAHLDAIRVAGFKNDLH